MVHYTLDIGPYEDVLHPSLPNPTRLWGYGQGYDAANASWTKHLGGVIVARREMSEGRWPDGDGDWYYMNPTTGTANVVELTTSVVINEIMYHPPTELDADEFIELYNAGSQQVEDGIEHRDGRVGNEAHHEALPLAHFPSFSGLHAAAELTVVAHQDPVLAGVVGAVDPGELARFDRRVEPLGIARCDGDPDPPEPLRGSGQAPCQRAPAAAAVGGDLPLPRRPVEVPDVDLDATRLIGNVRDPMAVGRGYDFMSGDAVL